MTPRTKYPVFLWLASLLVFCVPLSRLAALAAHDDRYTYVVVIPAISAVLIFLDRHSIFATASYCVGPGLAIVVAALAIFLASHSLSLQAFAIALVWFGIFLLCFGPAPTRAALFPLCFLFLMVPIPAAPLDVAILTLQSESARMSAFLFKLVSVPFFQHGFTFTLPGVEVEIAKQCSGIRSSMTLLISTILAGHFVLHSTWRRVCFSLFAIPVVIFKNALRIVTISWLGIHVDQSFLFGTLHHYSGLPFSLVAIILLAPLLWMLYRSEAAGGTST